MRAADDDKTPPPLKATRTLTHNIPKVEAEKTGNANVIRDLAFSLDGKLLAAATPHQITVWKAGTWEVAWTVKPDCGWSLCVESIAFSPDSKWLIYGTIGAAPMLSAATGQPGEKFAAEAERIGFASALAFSPDGGRLAMGGSSALQLWDVRTRQTLWSVTGPHKSTDINSVAFSPDGKTLVTCAGYVGISEGDREPDHSVRWWDAATGKMLRRVQTQLPISHVAFSSDGKLLFASSFNHMELWTADGARLAYLDATRTIPLGNNTFTFEGSYSRGKPALFRSRYLTCGSAIWDLQQASALKPEPVKLEELPTPLANVQYLSGLGEHETFSAASPDGKWLAIADASTTIQLWDLSKWGQ